MFVLRFALKNVLSRKSSIVIVAFIAFSLSLLVVANAVFDGTDSGMERTFVSSFTGNVVIRPKAEFPLSLFGDETPVTGSLSKIPHLVPFTQVSQYVSSVEGVAAVTPQFTGMAALNIGGEELDATEAVAVFGVDAGQYTAMMSGIQIISGKPFAKGERGAMINESMMKAIEAEGGSVSIGDTVQLIVPLGVSATIRAVPVTAIYRYPVTNPMIDRIVLADAPTVRDLMGAQDVNEGTDIAESERDLIAGGGEDGLGELDDLFSDAQDTARKEVGADAIADEFVRSLIEDKEREEEPKAESTVWSFLLCKTSARDTKRIIAQLNYNFRKNDWPVEAIKWRNAAGGTVNLVYYLRVISNVGILLILLVGFIVVNNTLTVSALGRICETGTIRALGGTRRFVALQFFCETFVLTFTAGVLGAAIGVALNAVLNNAQVPLGNSYLMQLFGSATLATRLTFSNIRGEMTLAVLLAFVGTMLPARIALSSSPVEAMRGQT